MALSDQPVNLRIGLSPDSLTCCRKSLTVDDTTFTLGFVPPPAFIDGTSDLLYEVWGPEFGRRALLGGACLAAERHYRRNQRRFFNWSERLALRIIRGGRLQPISQSLAQTRNRYWRPRKCEAPRNCRRASVSATVVAVRRHVTGTHGRSAKTGFNTVPL
jgi:hypothetical protein